MTKMRHNVKERVKRKYFDDIGQCSVIIRNIRLLTQMKMPANTSLFINLRRFFVCKLFFSPVFSFHFFFFCCFIKKKIFICEWETVVADQQIFSMQFHVFFLPTDTCKLFCYCFISFSYFLFLEDYLQFANRYKFS